MLLIRNFTEPYRKNGNALEPDLLLPPLYAFFNGHRLALISDLETQQEPGSELLTRLLPLPNTPTGLHPAGNGIVLLTPPRCRLLPR